MALRRGIASLAAFCACFGAGTAVAADLPLKAPPAAAGPSYAWSGFYVGAHAGYAFSSDKYDFDPAFATALGLGGVDLFGSRGFSGGFLTGYNVLFGERWLVGVEADWSWQDIKSEFTGDPNFVTLNLDTKQDWAASLRARLGYFVTPGTLVYGTAGWAWSKVDISVNSFVAAAADSANINGFQGGVGVETALTSNLHARLEYLQTFYDTAHFNDAVSTTIGIAGIRPTVGLARVAAIYQFGQAAPAAASSAMAAVPSNWTGFYAGGSLGGALGYGNVHFEGVGDIKGAGVAGPMPSLFVGYNYQFAPRWLIGAEAEIAPSIKSTDVKLGWLGAVRGRLGYFLMPDTLVYATAGWLGTQVDDLVYRNTVVVTGQHINGVQVGGGVEAAFAPQWDLRVDYQYAVMQRVDLTFPAAVGMVPATAEPRGHTGRIALVRRFGG